MNPQTRAERRVEIETWAEEDYQIVLKWMVENRAPEKIRQLMGEMTLAEFGGGEVEAQTPSPCPLPVEDAGAREKAKILTPCIFMISMLKI